jgi:circadian clock protein KaiB
MSEDLAGALIQRLLPVEAAIWHLRLYIAGQSSRSLCAFDNLTALCNEYLAGQYELEIIDLIEHPEAARRDDIVAIPTLVRTNPAPHFKIIGDLSDRDRVVSSLRMDAV